MLEMTLILKIMKFHYLFFSFRSRFGTVFQIIQRHASFILDFLWAKKKNRFNNHISPIFFTQLLTSYLISCFNPFFCLLISILVRFMTCILSSVCSVPKIVLIFKQSDLPQNLFTPLPPCSAVDSASSTRWKSKIKISLSSQAFNWHFHLFINT